MTRRLVFGVLGVMLLAGTNFGLEKETSLVTGEKVGELAVAGKLLIDVHAEFMMSRTFEKDTVLHWYNMGVSGGGRIAREIGGSFGDFGLHVPHVQRDEKYPHAVKLGDVPAARFDGGDIMKGNFEIEAPAVGNEDLAIEVWVQDSKPAKGEVIFGWQSDDGKQQSGAITYPKAFKGSDGIQLITVNCTADTETWYVDGKKVGGGNRKLRISEGHKMVLGGASSLEPSFDGSLVAFRLHEKAMTEEEIRHNAKGGVMLGTELHDWWRTEGNKKWRTDRSEHFRNCIARDGRLADMNKEQLKAFEDRLPDMFEMAEKIYHLYSERMAMRSSVVSAKREFRGDGIKYTIPNQPSNGSWMGWDGKRGFGWGCQGAGHINPHELVHGWQAQTGGTMQGNYWEAHANFPQTYVGVYQTVPPACVGRVCMFFPANGRCYYHDRLMFEHLSQTPEYGPMFISKLWYDGGTDEDKNEYPWTAFTKCDPDPSTDLAYEWTRMVQKCITWDYQIFGGKPADLYKKDGDWTKPEMKRYGQVLLERIPYATDWWRAPKEMSPQQLGYSICPLKIEGNRATAQLDGYISTERGGDWRAAFVGVTPDGNPVYGDMVKTGGEATLKTDGLKELYLVVCAVPTKIMAINMTGDFRSLEQEKFPYKLKLAGCSPIDVLANVKPASGGAPHSNGGGFVANSAQVDATAYVGPNAQVLGNSKVLGNARIEDHAVVDGSTVRDNAIVSGHALVKGGSIVQDNAKVRNWGRVRQGATIKDFAKVIEHGTQARSVCAGYATIKGVAVSSGNVRGNAMVDGSYAKSNEIDKGKWFTWSWSKGKNAGEVDKEFGGLYVSMLFDKAHEWMARDDFGATWGYLVGKPRIADGNLVLNGKTQFVELQDDVADMNDISIKVKVNWQGNGDAAIAEFSNNKGDRVFLGTKLGKCRFSISKDKKTQELNGPALKHGVPTEIMVVLSADTGKLLVNEEEVDENKMMTLNPDDVKATECFLGRAREGKYFKGAIDSFEIYSVPLKDEVAPSPDPAKLLSMPTFSNPRTVVMQAEVGVDPLGGVEYFFAETSGNPGGDDSGWTINPVYEDTGLEPGKEYSYTVKMRDSCGNVTKASEPATAKWQGGKAFKSNDGKTIAIEAESFIRKVAGVEAGRGIEWKLSPKRDGCSGKGMMVALPDRGVQVDAGFESQCPRLDYLVDFPGKGKYTAWMRSWGANHNGDSLFLGLDFKGTDRSLFHIGNGKLQWQKHRDWTFAVKEPGLHTLNVWMREDGSAFDKLVITLNSGMKEPEGKGPAESRKE